MLGSHLEVRIPDAIEPAEGWRTWRLATSYGKQVLMSPSQGTLWLPGQAFGAYCGHDQEARDKGCHCGVNAWSDREGLAADLAYKSMPVWGRVRQWGETHEFEQGLRSQFAAPAELHVRPSVKDAEQVAAQLSELYGVPCTVEEHPAYGVEGKAARSARISWRSRILWPALLSLPAFVALWISQVYSPRTTEWMLRQDPAKAEQLYPGGSLLMLMLPIMLMTLCMNLTIGIPAGRHWRAAHRVFSTGFGLVMILTTAALMLVTLFHPLGSKQAQQAVSSKEAIAKAKRTSQVVRIKATKPLQVAWMDEYTDYKLGECNRLHGVQVCRHGDTMVFTPGDVEPEDPAEQAGCTSNEALGVVACVVDGKAVIEPIKDQAGAGGAKAGAEAGEAQTAAKGQAA
jgi:hypothetical protein